MNYDYDRSRRAGLDFNVHLGLQPMPDGIPVLSSMSKVFVDGAPLGMITALECKVSASSFVPEFKIAVLGGYRREAFEQFSPFVKKSARETVAKLSCIPGVEVVCPDFLR